MRAIGLMSGTSMDGVDIAFVETDGESAVVLGATGFQPYSDEDRALLRMALAAAAGLEYAGARPDAVAEAELMVTARHAEAVEKFLADNNLRAGEIDLVGFHGQTVLHRPRQRLTIQIGDGAALAERLRIATVYDFRSADVAAGGEGAPIVPAFHRALVQMGGVPGPLALLNIGGVANVTYVDGERDPIACDTGPGNALLDDLMHARTGQPMDRHGHTAARGKVDEDALARLLDDPFFAVPPPKSLDRNNFSRAAVEHLALEDAAATLTAFTAASVGKLLPLLPQAPRSLVVCGGGASNPILVRELVQRLPCKVTTADVCGWSADAMEAQAFAYLAVRAWRGLPYTYPTTTGAPVPTCGGVLAEPAKETSA
ncbi:MAG: anhydro-N-acetylmuramic acid kinase [Rhodoblastus sp.]